MSNHTIDPSIKQEVRQKYNFRPSEDSPPPSKELQDSILYIDSIDLSKFDQGDNARKELANQLEKSLADYGFFKLVNHGLEPELLETLKSISQSTFETSDEVKQIFFAGSNILPQDKGLELGVIRGSGYKPRGYWTYTNDTHNNVELFNFRHFLHPDIFFDQTKYPEFVKHNLDDISRYFNFLHKEVQRKVLILMDIILQLPQGTLYNNYFPVIENDTQKSGTGVGRILLYHPVGDDYNKKISSTWMRGHSDAGALTFILSQPILSLQIRTHDTNEWKYVDHTPNALIVNIGDTFHHLTSGYFKSSIHRVHTAPKDQQKYTRNTVIYFASPTLDIFMDPETLKSPKLNRLGFLTNPDLERITVRQWDEAKGKFFNKTSANQKKAITIYGRESIGSLISEPTAIRT